MATNVSEKDKTLNEIIDWCENQRRKILADIEPAPGEDAEEAYADLESVIRSDNPIIKYSNDLLDGSEAFVYGVIMQARLLDHIIDHCRSMLGYSGSMLSCLTYEDTDNSDPSDQPQVGDYGVAVREHAHGQEEIPFHIEREEHTGLPVALLNERLYAKPEDDIKDGLYVSLFQLYLDGFVLSRTGRKRNKDAEA